VRPSTEAENTLMIPSVLDRAPLHTARRAEYARNHQVFSASVLDALFPGAGVAAYGTVAALGVAAGLISECFRFALGRRHTQVTSLELTEQLDRNYITFRLRE